MTQDRINELAAAMEALEKKLCLVYELINDHSDRIYSVEKKIA
jgi:hypothetical protein